MNLKIWRAWHWAWCNVFIIGRLKIWLLPVAENKPCSSVTVPLQIQWPIHPFQVQWLFSTFTMWSLHESHFENGPIPEARGGHPSCPAGAWNLQHSHRRHQGILTIPRGAHSVASTLTTHTCSWPGLPDSPTFNKTHNHSWSRQAPQPKIPVALGLQPALLWRAVQPFYWSWHGVLRSEAAPSRLAQLLVMCPSALQFCVDSSAGQPLYQTRRGPGRSSAGGGAGSPLHVFLDTLCNARERVRRTVLNKTLAILSHLLGGNIR